MLGTRILYYIVEIPEIMKDPSILWDFKNGYVVYGGIIGGILASYICCRTKKQAFMPYFDLVSRRFRLHKASACFGCFFAGLLLRQGGRMRGTESRFITPRSHRTV